MDGLAGHPPLLADAQGAEAASIGRRGQGGLVFSQGRAAAAAAAAAGTGTAGACSATTIPKGTGGAVLAGRGCE